MADKTYDGFACSEQGRCGSGSKGRQSGASPSCPSPDNVRAATPCRAHCRLAGKFDTTPQCPPTLAVTCLFHPRDLMFPRPLAASKTLPSMRGSRSRCGIPTHCQVAYKSLTTPLMKFDAGLHSSIPSL